MSAYDDWFIPVLAAIMFAVGWILCDEYIIPLIKDCLL